MRNLGIALALAFIVLLPMGAQAQGETCELQLEPADDLPRTGNFSPGDQRVYTFVVSNSEDNTFDADGTFRILSTLPDGWFWSPTEQRVSVATGEEQTVEVTVRYEEAVGRDAQMQAQVQDVNCEAAPIVGSASGPDTDIVSLAFTHAPMAGAQAEDETPWVWIVFGAIVAGAVVGVPIVHRSRGSRINATCDESEREVQPGRGTSYPIRIENEGSNAVAIDLDVTDVQEGWSALTTLPSLELGPDESRTVYMMVRAPEEAKSGDLCVAKLGVTPEGGGMEEIKTLTRVDEDADGENGSPASSQASNEEQT